jgi:alpha-mannosidase
VDPASVTLRLVETHGRSAEFVVRSGLCGVSPLAAADLLERPAGGVITGLHGYQIATVRGRLDGIRIADADHQTLAPDAEEAQPLYARYWLHNRGPAPLGGLPVVAHLHPSHVPAAEPVVRLRLTAASDCTDTAVHGRVRLVLPPGWTAEPAELSFVLPPGEYLDADIEVTRRPDDPQGLYPIRAELAARGRAELAARGHGLPAAWHQVVEDVCLVTVGAPAGAEVLRLLSGPEAVRLRAGERGRLTVTVGTDAMADLAVEAHLISPWGTWEWLGPAATGAELAARGTLRLDFDVAPPPWVPPGRWWALIRVACAGRLVYSPAVAVEVLP